MTSTTSTPKSVKHVTENDSSFVSPLAGPGPGGHKPSFKNTKLARRARSFKDDFLGKFSQMRSPANSSPGSGGGGGGGLRSHSPKERVGCKIDTSNIADHYHSPTTFPLARGPKQELENLWKQTQATLKHFRDVVSKQKLEMLPGNGTIVLDTVWQINLAVRSAIPADSESSSAIFSATNHMYQSVARLIKLCDDALIDDKSSELTTDNVNEIVAQVEMAVQDLIQLALEKIAGQKAAQGKVGPPRTSYGNASLDMPAQRNSLPDIPLTPRERQLLAENSCSPTVVRNSHSSESILREAQASPPPKPPLPDSIIQSNSTITSCITPPPLPPKKKNFKFANNNQPVTDGFNSCGNSPIASSLERVSIRSKSPEDSISLLSASAGSLDSILNNSREEEEIQALMGPGCFEGDSVDNHTSDIFGANGSWEESSLTSNISNQTIDYNRLSNTDSGIMSSQSYRTSSYSKRSSQQSSVSSQWSTNNITQHQQQQQNSISKTATATLAHVETVKSESLLQKNNDALMLTVKNVNQKTSSSSSSSSSLVSTIVNSSAQLSLNDSIGEDAPPAIPQKTRKKTAERQPSPYDNVPDSSLGEVLVTCQMHQSHQNLSTSSSTMALDDSIQPPPLPPKKKYIMAYMEMFGNCSHANEQEFMRHSVHMVQAQQWGAQHQQNQQQQPSTSTLPTTQSCSFSHTSQTSSTTSSRSSSSTCAHHSVHLPAHSHNDQRVLAPSPSKSLDDPNIPPALPPKQNKPRTNYHHPKPMLPPPVSPIIATHNHQQQSLQSPVQTLPDLLEHTPASNPAINNSIISHNSSSNNSKSATGDNNEQNANEVAVAANKVVSTCDIDLMEELNGESWLLFKKPDEDGPDIRGGMIDALIIQATKATKNGVFAYQEAFLTTYRTFIAPSALIQKLIRRYNHFYYKPQMKSRSTEAFALIVRVVSDLTVSDLDDEIQSKLMNFVQQLISNGELILAKALRVKHLERHDAKRQSMKSANIVASLSLSARQHTLLDFKSEQIAEQMTLLDAELFMKIEIPEVLIWAQEQNEERSPNLTRFTEHFNKMSYWARTRILTAETKDVREKYFLKFIKIMKHLRKINNFNSYLALLSALDSAPIRRLEWQKHVQEGLKEYCALIDSSSSFRAYRQALAETSPPCIPYIGLVLQDLTFVHIGNSNLLTDGKINFSKRWQQFNIVENMKKFKKGTHNFKRNDRIIQFFQNFDDFIGEDAMWQLSESIKPRGGKKTS